MSGCATPLRRECALLCNERASVPGRFRAIEAPPPPSDRARGCGRGRGVNSSRQSIAGNPHTNSAPQFVGVAGKLDWLEYFGELAMSNVVGLRGCEPYVKEPVESVVAKIEELLELARSGEIIGIQCVAMLSGCACRPLSGWRDQLRRGWDAVLRCARRYPAHQREREVMSTDRRRYGFVRPACWLRRAHWFVRQRQWSVFE
jgi:hypothetical protein